MWIIKCLLLSGCLMLACLQSAFSSEDTQQNKTELIQSEIAYARYIIFQSQIGCINHEFALNWVDAILLIVEEQLEEE